MLAKKTLVGLTILSLAGPSCFEDESKPAVCQADSTAIAPGGYTLLRLRCNQEETQLNLEPTNLVGVRLSGDAAPYLSIVTQVLDHPDPSLDSPTAVDLLLKADENLPPADYALEYRVSFGAGATQLEALEQPKVVVEADGSRVLLFEPDGAFESGTYTGGGRTQLSVRQAATPAPTAEITFATDEPVPGVERNSYAVAAPAGILFSWVGHGIQGVNAQAMHIGSDLKPKALLRDATFEHYGSPDSFRLLVARQRTATPLAYDYSLETAGEEEVPTGLEVTLGVEPATQVQPGTIVTLDAVTDGGSGRYGYRWLVNGIDQVINQPEFAFRTTEADASVTVFVTDLSTNQGVSSNTLVRVVDFIVDISTDRAPPFARGSDVVLTAEATGGTEPYTYTWGATDQQSERNGNQMRLIGVATTMDVTLSVTDAANRVVMAQKTVTVSAGSSGNLEAYCLATPQYQAVNTPGEFEAFVTVGTATKYEWAFEAADAYAVGGSMVSFTYRTPGERWVRLRVSNDTDSHESTCIVNVEP